MSYETNSPIPSSSTQSATTSESSWLEDLQENDSTTIYSYYSTWSSNYTMSNLEGPGRLLGNLYSRAGSILERRLGKLAYRAGSSKIAKADSILLDGMELSKDRVKMEKACNILMRGARYVYSYSIPPSEQTTLKSDMKFD